MVQIERNDADEDGDSDKNDGEEEVFADQWYDEACWRHQVDHEQEEEGDSDENANGECDFVSFRVRRYVEDERGEYSDQHARHDQVDGEEETLSSKCYRVSDVDISIRAATARVLHLNKVSFMLSSLL